MSARLHFVVEGPTEEMLVNRILIPHLGRLSVWGDVHSVTTHRAMGRRGRGGLMTYAQAKNDVVFWMREDRNSDAFFTTMFDLYALPEDFPDYGSCCSVADPYSRVEKLEEAFKGDIGEQRFVPHIQLHEYEALLFSDPDRLVSQYPDEGKAIHDLISSVSSFKSPELINDGVSTAPSKRILRAIPQYSKTSGGLLVAVEIGLATIRSKCPHFDRWVSCLETLGGVSP